MTAVGAGKKAQATREEAAGRRGNVSSSKRRGRRRNGEGSITRRSDGRYQAAVFVTNSDGQRRRRYFTASTETEVLGKLREALSAEAAGIPSTPQNVTVGKYLDRWLAESVRPSVKESTYMTYEKDVRLHIAPTLGKLRLPKLAPVQVQALYARLLSDGLSANTVVHVHRVLSRALAQAERWGLVARNVARLTDPPRVETEPVAAFNNEQARRFLDAVAVSRLQALYVVALATGLRRGELLALQWDDIDFDAGTVTVKRALSKARSGWRMSEPKTRKARRQVRLPAFAIEALRAHRIRQKTEQLVAPAWGDASIVFASSAGTHLDGRNVLRDFKRQLPEAGLPEVFTFHSLRHSAATLMLGLGVPAKVVSETLGHARIAVTMDVYSHVLPHLQEEAASKMNALLASG